jgi:DUF1680 family protein
MLFLQAVMLTLHFQEQPRDHLRAVPFTQVKVSDDFWSRRIETNRAVTIPYCFAKCEETGRIANFEKAGGLVDGEFQGIYYDDSDVYKVIEGAAYSLAAHPDPELDRYLDELIAKIAAAQENDGYLNTYHTLVAPGEKWSNIKDKHELYCAGHLFEAAVAHFQATRKRSLLDVAIKLADHIDRTFGPAPEQNHHPSGHEEIEIGLVKLYGVTGERRYLDLAKYLLDQRGNTEGHQLYGKYAQDHLPVTEQREPVGHAVRAMYLYAGMADVAALSGNDDYLDALDAIWENMVETKLYLTGGIGARGAGEAFGDDYELPNESAYNETCAAIGNALWNHRMNLLHGDAKYADVLELVLYNGFLSGVSMAGDRFFYPNPLASGGTYHRSPWFSTSCCPVNVARFVPSIPGYIYAQSEDAIYINLFVQSEAEIELGGQKVKIRQTTDYPWDDTLEIMITPEQPSRFDLHIRLPEWSGPEVIESDLYQQELRETKWYLEVKINGESLDRAQLDPMDGYMSISREWSAGDRIAVNLPFSVRVITADDRVAANRGRVALMRGPIVYCVEAADTDGYVRHLSIDPDQEFTAEHRDDLLGGVTVIKGIAQGRYATEAGGVEEREVPFTAIPYYAWDHRAPGEMAVWLPTSPDLAAVIPAPTIASRGTPSASFCYQNDSVLAVNDQLEPSSSSDHSIPRLTFWPHLGTTEWVQLDLPEIATVSSVEVYWFDDTGRGQCRVPRGWRLMYRDGDDWKPVESADRFGVQPDQYNRVSFKPVQTDALRIELDMAPQFSAGILEWKVN